MSRDDLGKEILWYYPPSSDSEITDKIIFDSQEAEKRADEMTDQKFLTRMNKIK